MNKIKSKPILMIAFIILIGTMLYICKSYGMLNHCTPQSMKNYISSFGMLAPAVYIIMFTIIPLTLFPDAVLALAGGMVFGVGCGTLYTILGAACGGTLSFFISRVFGRDLVKKLTKEKMQWFEDGIEKRGFLFILLLRLIPLIPFDVISYGAGLSKIRYRDFIVATFLGIIPGVWVYSNLGDKSGNLFSIEFLEAVAILIMLIIISYFIKKKFSLKTLQNKITENL